MTRTANILQAQALSIKKLDNFFAFLLANAVDYFTFFANTTPFGILPDEKCRLFFIKTDLSISFFIVPNIQS